MSKVILAFLLVTFGSVFVAGCESDQVKSDRAGHWGIVDLVKETRLHDTLGGVTTKVFVGIKLEDLSRHVTVECQDGIVSDFDECFGLKQGDKVLTYLGGFDIMSRPYWRISR